MQLNVSPVAGFPPSLGGAHGVNSATGLCARLGLPACTEPVDATERNACRYMAGAIDRAAYLRLRKQLRYAKHIRRPLIETRARARSSHRVVCASKPSASSNDSDDGEPDSEPIAVVIDPDDDRARILVPVGNITAVLVGPVPTSDADFAALRDLARRAVAGDPSVGWLS